MKFASHLYTAGIVVTSLAFSSAVLAQANLPFPKTSSASKAGITLQESEHHWRQEPNRLPADAPNIVIILTDDSGFGNPSTFGGPINTPTLTRLTQEGIKYNAFHTTAICSPTRAARVYTVDIALTLATIVGAKPPSGASGEVLLEVLGQ